MDTFFRCKSGQSVKLTNGYHLVLMIRMHIALLAYLLYAFMEQE